MKLNFGIGFTLLLSALFILGCSNGNSNNNGSKDPISVDGDKPTKEGAFVGTYSIEVYVRGVRKMSVRCNSNSTTLEISEDIFDLAIAPLKCLDGNGQSVDTAQLGRYLGAPIKDGKIDFGFGGNPEGTVTEKGVTISRLADEGGLSEIRLVKLNANQFTYSEVNTNSKSGQVTTMKGSFSRPNQ